MEILPPPLPAISFQGRMRGAVAVRWLAVMPLWGRGVPSAPSAASAVAMDLSAERVITDAFLSSAFNVSPWWARMRSVSFSVM